MVEKPSNRKREDLFGQAPGIGQPMEIKPVFDVFGAGAPNQLGGPLQLPIDQPHQGMFHFGGQSPPPLFPPGQPPPA
jgi:hypothetical protein